MPDSSFSSSLDASLQSLLVLAGRLYLLALSLPLQYNISSIACLFGTRDDAAGAFDFLPNLTFPTGQAETTVRSLLSVLSQCADLPEKHFVSYALFYFDDRKEKSNFQPSTDFASIEPDEMRLDAAGESERQRRSERGAETGRGRPSGEGGRWKTL